MNRKQVYFLNKIIYFFSDEENFQHLREDLFFVSKSASTEKIWQDFMLFMQQEDYSQLVFFGKNYKKLFTHFKEQFVPINAAGGLLKNEKNEILFIFRNGKWDLPKGKVEANEKIRHAAERECMEECGLRNIHIGKKLVETYHMYEMDGTIVFKTTYWYKMKVSSRVKLIPQKEEGIERICWFKPDDLLEVRKNTYSNIIDVLNAANVS